VNPKPISPDELQADLVFPIRGTDSSDEAERQPDFTTPLGQNVRAYDVFLLRQRGGSRPGLVKYLPGRPEDAPPAGLNGPTPNTNYPVVFVPPPP
jgi:hypothetical protein